MEPCATPASHAETGVACSPASVQPWTTRPRRAGEPADAYVYVDREAFDTHIAAGWSDRAITRAVLGREDGVHYVSSGDLSKVNFVKAVRTGAALPFAG